MTTDPEGTTNAQPDAIPDPPALDDLPSMEEADSPRTSEEDDPTRATEEPAVRNPFAGEDGAPQVSAAEREYQAAMRAAAVLGMGDLSPVREVDREAAAAVQLAERLGLRSTRTEPESKIAEVERRSELARGLTAEEARRETEEEEEILGPDIGDGRAWFVINTYSGHENRVKQNLERRIASMDVSDRIFRVVVPTEEELEIRGGQRRQVQRKLLPGYVLAEMILDEVTWYVVRNTPGVTGFVGGDTPQPLPRHEAKNILKQMRVVEPRIRVGFEISDTVRVTEGPFQDFMGEVDEINLDKGKVRVLISMFGRETPVELDFMQVEKV